MKIKNIMIDIQKYAKLEYGVLLKVGERLGKILKQEFQLKGENKFER